MFSNFTFPDAFSPEECARIVALTDGGQMADAGLVGGETNHNLRRADIAWLDDCDGSEWVMDRIMEVVRRANRELYDFVLTEFAESPQVARYDAAREGHFTWHSDIGDGPAARRRKLTIVVQLSDPTDYDGGALELMPDANIATAARTQGAATLFPSFVLHRVTPVTRGVRHSLTLWSHGPSFR